MNTIVLGYSGGCASSIAVHWLAETHGANVVTVTVDVGQGRDLGELRGRALARGAVRAHAIDGRDDLAREFLLPSLGSSPRVDGSPMLDELPRPLIARKLLEIARIEGTRLVAHGSLDTSLDECILEIDPAVTVLAPAREWGMSAAQIADYARARGVPPRDPAEATCRIEQNLWGRMVSWPDGDPQPASVLPGVSSTSTEPARLDIHVERGMPVSVNGVPLSPVELVESLALIAGRHGVGRLEAGGGGRRVVYDAPAAVVLQAALAAAGEGGGVVRLSVLNGRCTVLALHDPNPELVNHA